MNVLKNNNNLLKNISFSIILFMILLRRYMYAILNDNIDISKITSLLFYGYIGLLFIYFLLMRKHNISEWILFIAAGILYVFTREGSIIVFILLAISIRDIDNKYVVKNYLIMNIIFIIIGIIIGNLYPEIAQDAEIHYRFQNGILKERETFGFGNPNSVFLFSLTVYAAYIYLRFDKYNNLDRFILIALTVFIYNRTYSRTGFITILAGLIFIEILRYINLNKNKKISGSIKLLPIICTIGSLIIGTVLSKVTILNEMLASRPKYWHVYLVEHGRFLTLFGNRYSQLVKESNPLDSSYVYMIACLGIVSLIFFMFIIYKGLDILIKNNQKKYIAVIVLFLIYSLAENILLEAAFNFTIILLIKQIILDNTFKNMIRREK